MTIDRLCKECGRSGHTRFGCPKRRKPMKQTTTLKARKPMRKIGKVGKALIEQSKQFLTDTKPPYNCIYCLYIGIDIPLLIEDCVINVEHTESKAKHPDLRFVKGNLAIACAGHNQAKGTLDIEQYLAILDKQREVSNEQI